MHQPQCRIQLLIKLLEEQRFPVHRIYGYAFFTALPKLLVSIVRICVSGEPLEIDRTHHFTSTRDSFLGHICSSVSALILSCSRSWERMARCAEDLRIDCPVISLCVNLSVI